MNEVCTINALRKMESQDPGFLSDDFSMSLEDLSKVQHFEFGKRKRSRARAAARPLAAMLIDLKAMLDFASA